MTTTPPESQKGVWSILRRNFVDPQAKYRDWARVLLESPTEWTPPTPEAGGEK